LPKTFAFASLRSKGETIQPKPRVFTRIFYVTPSLRGASTSPTVFARSESDEAIQPEFVIFLDCFAYARKDEKRQGLAMTQQERNNLLNLMQNWAVKCKKFN
jgi:hypothetical protein